MDQALIGMIVPTLDNSFFSSLAVQIEKEMAKRGYRLLVAGCGHDAEKEKAYYKEMMAIQVSGLISVSGLSELPEDLIPDSLPLVWVDRVPASGRKIPWVANDDARAMEMAVDYLIEKGSRDILLLPGFLAEKQESPRVKGYKKALKKHGIAFREEFVLNRMGKKSSEEETGELIRRLFASGSVADGVIASSDRAAFGAIRALQTIGYFVPEDVRLIGFDNSSYASMASPSVTSLDRKADLLAEKTCEIMDQLVQGRTPASFENVIPVTLEKRDSTR